MNCISKLVVTQLKKIINNIESGNCELTEEEALNLLSVISNEPMSKEQACSCLNISRSKFDDYTRKGVLPKGRKRRGFKELVWYKSELIIK